MFINQDEVPAIGEGWPRDPDEMRKEILDLCLKRAEAGGRLDYLRQRKNRDVHRITMEYPDEMKSINEKKNKDQRDYSFDRLCLRLSRDDSLSIDVYRYDEEMNVIRRFLFASKIRKQALSIIRKIGLEGIDRSEAVAVVKMANSAIKCAYESHQLLKRKEELYVHILDNLSAPYFNAIQKGKSEKERKASILKFYADHIPEMLDVKEGIKRMIDGYQTAGTELWDLYWFLYEARMEDDPEHDVERSTAEKDVGLGVLKSRFGSNLTGTVTGMGGK